MLFEDDLRAKNRERGTRKRKESGEIRFKHEPDCFVNCSVNDKYDRPHHGRRIIPPMFHYTVNHRVCPVALGRKTDRLVLINRGRIASAL